MWERKLLKAISQITLARDSTKIPIAGNLGMLLDRRMNPKIAEEHAVWPYMAAQSRISEFAKRHRAGLMQGMLWLSKVYGIPAGMYAS